MKLSTAIRIGIPLIPAQPLGGGYIDYDENVQPISACVLGTAAIGNGYQGNGYYYGEAFDNALDTLEGMELIVEMPEGVESKWGAHHAAGSLAAELYEAHEWSREKIADYLESVGA